MTFRKKSRSRNALSTVGTQVEIEDATDRTAHRTTWDQERPSFSVRTSKTKRLAPSNSASRRPDDLHTASDPQPHMRSGPLFVTCVLTRGYSVCGDKASRAHSGPFWTTIRAPRSCRRRLATAARPGQRCECFRRGAGADCRHYRRDWRGDRTRTGPAIRGFEQRPFTRHLRLAI